MTIENLTGQDRILLWDITGQHPAHERVDAVAKALRLIGKLADALAAAERRATRDTASADEEYVVRKAAERDRDAARALLREALDAINQEAWTVLADGIRAHLSGQHAAPATTAAEARVRELETNNASLRERNTELVHLKQVAEARVRELESRIERQRVANRGMHRSLDERDAELAALRERVQSWERVALSDDTTREAVHLCLHDKETELNQLRERVAKALAALESPAWPPLARIQDTLEALRG